MFEFFFVQVLELDQTKLKIATDSVFNSQVFVLGDVPDMCLLSNSTCTKLSPVRHLLHSGFQARLLSGPKPDSKAILQSSVVPSMCKVIKLTIALVIGSGAHENYKKSVTPRTW